MRRFIILIGAIALTLCVSATLWASDVMAAASTSYQLLSDHQDQATIQTGVSASYTMKQSDVTWRATNLTSTSYQIVDPGFDGSASSSSSSSSLSSSGGSSGGTGGGGSTTTGGDAHVRVPRHHPSHLPPLLIRYIRKSQRLRPRLRLPHLKKRKSSMAPLKTRKPFKYNPMLRWETFVSSMRSTHSA